MKRIFYLFLALFFFLNTSQIIYSQDKRGVRLGKYFSFLGICDWSYRQTNIYDEDYIYYGGWIYGKIVWNKLNIGGKNKHLPFGLYISGTLASSDKEKPWENNYVFGLGIEKYLFYHTEKIPSIFKNLRIYAEYLKLGYIKEKAEEWVPDSDIRFGFDLYKDFGIGKGKTNETLWQEVWANVCWQKTNFFMDDYKSFTASYNYKIGLRLLKNFQFSLMPYLLNEVSWTARHDFFWQNRALLGLGIRSMPFQKANFDLWNHLKIFTEYIRVVAYFKEKPPINTPEYDFRVGMVFSIGFWK